MWNAGFCFSKIDHGSETLPRSSSPKTRSTMKLVRTSDDFANEQSLGVINCDGHSRTDHFMTTVLYVFGLGTCCVRDTLNL